jgi:hypothetical protein
MPRTYSLVMGCVLAAPAGAEDCSTWLPHQPSFRSTGNGRLVIDEDATVVVDDRCVARFTATLPNALVFANHAARKAAPAEGRVSSTDAGGLRWTAAQAAPRRVLTRDRLTRRASD